MEACKSLQDWYDYVDRHSRPLRAKPAPDDGSPSLDSPSQSGANPRERARRYVAALVERARTVLRESERIQEAPAPTTPPAPTELPAFAAVPAAPIAPPPLPMPPPTPVWPLRGSQRARLPETAAPPVADAAAPVRPSASSPAPPAPRGGAVRVRARRRVRRQPGSPPARNGGGMPPAAPALPAGWELLLHLPASEVAQNSYKSPFRESREELIRRLLDPSLNLEEVARLLGVCPTTVRRYTNRGLLKHYRTPGNQRRFRLSHVLEFLAQHGPPGGQRSTEHVPKQPGGRTPVAPRQRRIHQSR